MSNTSPQGQRRSSSGALVTAVENSTKPVTVKVHHPGIAIVDQFNLRLP